MHILGIQCDHFCICMPVKPFPSLFSFESKLFCNTTWKKIIANIIHLQKYFKSHYSDQLLNAQILCIRKYNEEVRWAYLYRKSSGMPQCKCKQIRVRVSNTMSSFLVYEIFQNSAQVSLCFQTSIMRFTW